MEIVVLVVLASPVAVAQPDEDDSSHATTPPLQSTLESPASPAIEPAELLAKLEDSLERVYPIVAEILGEPDLRKPQVQVMTEDEVKASILVDTKAVLERGLPEDSEVTAERLTQSGFGFDPTTALVARYSINARSFLTVPEYASTYLAAATRMGVSEEDAMDLIVAHELVHAAQDQRIGLLPALAAGVKGAFDRQRLESIFVTNAVIEGQACLVQLEVAERIGGEPLRTWARSMLPGEGPVTNQMTRIYLYGLRYMETVERAEGMEGVWNAVRTPPSSIRALEERAGQRGDALERAFSDLDDIVGAEGWMAVRRDGVSQALGAGYSMLDAQQHAAIERGLRSASLLGRMRMPNSATDTPRALTISILTYESDDAAGAACAHLPELLDLMTLRFTLRPDGTREPKPSATQPVQGGELHVTSGESVLPGGGRSFGCFAWGLIGSRLLLVNGVDVPESEDGLAALLVAIAERMARIDTEP